MTDKPKDETVLVMKAPDPKPEEKAGPNTGAKDDPADSPKSTTGADPVVPAPAPKPVTPIAPVAPVVAAAPAAKVENPKPDDPSIATGEPHPEPEPKAKTPAARLDALEARLAYLTALMGWPSEEHDEKLADKARSEQVDFAGNPVKAA